MGPRQKFITGALWVALLLVMVGVGVAEMYRPRHESLPILFPAAQFTLTDQTNRQFSDRDLRGHPYIATFIFTTCAASCPIVTAEMSRLQHQVPDGVHLVSFSVDPQHDTPAVLEQYARNYQADESRWHFLTGTSDQMFSAAAGMKLVARAAQADQPILHSDHLLLVDGEGNVRGIYDSKEDSSIRQLADDATELAASR
jgi:protein SCO1/2